MKGSSEPHVFFNSEPITFYYHPTDSPAMSFNDVQSRKSDNGKTTEHPISPLKGDVNMSVGFFFESSSKTTLNTETMKLHEIRQSLRRYNLSTKGNIETLRKRLEQHLKKPTKVKKSKKKITIAMLKSL
ncbi:SAP domain-containing protein [Entamoeba marina]